MAEKIWFVYKLFHDPPGKAKELKCVTCKVASGCGVLTLGGAMFGYAKRLTKTDGHRAVAMTAAAVITVTFGATLLRYAYENNKYNIQLQKEFDAILRKERLATRELINKQDHGKIDELKQVNQNVMHS